MGHVVAGAADHGVVAAVAHQGVVPALAQQAIVPLHPVDQVRLAGPGQPVVARRADDLHADLLELRGRTMPRSPARAQHYPTKAPVLAL
jgi:hypothetical protein